MFIYFKELLYKFAGHQFRAQWQNEQLSSLRENLLPNHCVVIHYYSENYVCKEKFEFSINLEIVLDLLKTFALNMTTISS